MIFVAFLRNHGIHKSIEISLGPNRGFNIDDDALVFFYFIVYFKGENDMKDEILYLVKFVKKNEHALDLYDGKIYMRTANYYKYHLNSEARDNYEGNVSHSHMISKGTNHYIFSTFAITKRMVEENYKISYELIKHFGCENGYAVIIDFDKFSNKLKNSSNKVYNLIGSLISYKSIQSFEHFQQLLEGEHFESLRIKHPKFKDEHEYRLISGNVSDNDEIPFELDIGSDLYDTSVIIGLENNVHCGFDIPVRFFANCI